MSKQKDKDFSYEIIALHGYLNDKQNKVLATVKYGDNEPKLNVRNCWMKDGELKLGSGITLSHDDADVLCGLLASARNTGELSHMTVEGKKAVSFNAIFAEAAGIVEKRDAGDATKDGFTVLKKVPGAKLDKYRKK